MQHRNNNWHIRVLLLLAAFLCGLAFYSESYAAPPPAASPWTQPDSGSMGNSDMYDPADGSAPEFVRGGVFCPYKYDSISGRVVVCIEKIIKYAAKKFLVGTPAGPGGVPPASRGFLDVYENLLYAAMILAVTIYGAMLMMGTLRKPAVETFTFLLKLGAVAFFSVQFGGMIDNVFGIIKSMATIVTKYVVVSDTVDLMNNGNIPGVDDGNGPSCGSVGTNLANVYKGRGAAASNTIDLWDRVDCIFITLLGIGVGVAAPIGLVAILGGVIFSGGIGIIIFALAILFILTLLAIVVRAVKFYLTSVIAVAFLMCISPLCIPLLLFANTKPIFDQWLKNLANYMVMPMFLFAYLSMIIAAFDALLFRGNTSLYYAIASEASQQPNFNFKDWVEYGVDGTLKRATKPDGTPDPNGEVLTDAQGAPMSTGTVVGKDIPDVNAQTILGYKLQCNGASDTEREKLGEICDKSPEEFDKLFECAINPAVAEADGGGEGDNCDKSGKKIYYGFQKNAEILNFALTPGVETDQDKREEKDCGTFDLICHGTKAVGAVVNFAKNVVGDVVGFVFRVGGWILQQAGTVLKGLASILDAPCRLTPLPGAVCLQSKILMVAGSVTHTVGTIANFSGRVLMNGLANELGELFSGFLDVTALDLHKIAAYKCKSSDTYLNLVGSPDPSNPLSYKMYIKPFEDGGCPGPRELILEILYIFAAALVMAHIMYLGLNYIPSLGKDLLDAVAVDLSLPFESSDPNRTGRLQHGLEMMASRSRKRGQR